MLSIILKALSIFRRREKAAAPLMFSDMIKDKGFHEIRSTQGSRSMN